MHDAGTVYIIDAGNSSIKVARFENDRLVKVNRFNYNELKELHEFVRKPQGQSILSSVKSDEETANIVNQIDNLIEIHSDTILPFALNYKSTSTLGIDRICNAAYLHSKMQTNHAVAIDIGTCIKFDLLSRSEGYMGGAISPGIDLRYKALNDYTGKLPLLSNKSPIDFVGTNTESSMQSGVINGIRAEIIGIMDQYRSRYSDLTFFMTGGDAKYFDILAKNDIFADENLTLCGLYEIYKYNA